MTEESFLPAVGVRLWQTDVGQNAVSEFARHHIQARGPIVEGRDQRKDRGAGVGRSVHVADMDFVERCFAYAQHQWALFFQADVGGALDQVGGDAVSDAREGSDTARDNNHGASGIGAAGDVRADVGIGLLVNFAFASADELTNEVATAAKTELFRHDSKGTVRGDEVYGLDALVAFDGKQEMLQE